MYHEKQEKYLGYQEKLENLSCISGETGEPIMYIRRNRETIMGKQENQDHYVTRRNGRSTKSVKIIRIIKSIIKSFLYGLYCGKQNDST